MWNPFKRRAVSGGLVTGSQGKYLIAPPAGDDSTSQVVPVGYYSFHKGDVFTAGTANWALDPKFDTPLHTIWGNGVLVRNVHAFRPIQPTPMYTRPAAPITALRGMMVDSMPLETLRQLPDSFDKRFNG